jgi:hypothetical protein
MYCQKHSTMSYCSQERAELLFHTWKKFRRLDARGCWLPVCDAGPLWEVGNPNYSS